MFAFFYLGIYFILFLFVCVHVSACLCLCKFRCTMYVQVPLEVLAPGSQMTGDFELPDVGAGN